jgi:hypothetical protein
MVIRVQPPAGNSQEVTRIAKLLIAAADSPGDVQTVTDGPTVGFLVPDDVAGKVNLDPDVELTDDKGEKVTPSGADKKKSSSKKGNA